MEQTDAPVAVPARIWTLTDGHAGNVRQAEALAGALGVFSAKTVATATPWRWFAPRRWPNAERAFGADFSSALARPPRLAIGCGRQAALATRVLRERGARAVQILDPRIDPKHWDAVIAPSHDRVRGQNVLHVVGSLNPIDDRWLEDARGHWPALAALGAPRIAVLLGGDSAHARFGTQEFSALAARLDALTHGDDSALMITASRRTGDAVRAALRARYAGSAGLLWIDDRDGANPYAGMLGWASRIVCTGDSVNMVSEACATRAAVRVFAPDDVSGRPRTFLEDLIARGRIAALDANDDPAAFTGEPLRETARAAAWLRARLGDVLDA